MSAVAVRTCAKCGRSSPITEMRAIHEEVRSGRSSGRSFFSASNGGSMSYGAGSGYRSTHSHRTTSGHIGGATRYRDVDNFYCEPGCYEARLIERRRERALRVAAYTALVLACLGAALWYYLNRTPSFGAGEESAPPASQNASGNAAAAVATAAIAEPKNARASIESTSPPTDKPAEPQALPQQMAEPAQRPLPTPDDTLELARAIDSALSTGDPQRWTAVDRSLSGGVSVSGVQTYPDRECRSYRYTVEIADKTQTAPAGTGCALTGQRWSHTQHP